MVALAMGVAPKLSARGTLIASSYLPFSYNLVFAHWTVSTNDGPTTEYYTPLRGKVTAR